MKAIIINEFGSPAVLQLTDTPIPVPGENEVLVKAKAISINPVDVKTRSGAGMAGRLKQMMPVILGWDISGTVAASNDIRFKVGDDVFGMVNFPGHGKAYAEYVTAPADHFTLKPSTISHEEAAAATLAALTAWQVLVQHTTIRKGDRVLIHAAAGGVGHYAVQLAKHLGAYVVGTSSAANRDFVKSLGADEHIDYRSVKFEEATNNIDFVFDTIGGDNIARSLTIIKPGGALISIPTGIKPDIAALASSKNIDCRFELVYSSGKDMEQIAGLLEQGILKSHVSAVLDLNEMAKAHEMMETGRTVGKIVLAVR
ncbi:NADP-dependent oxidoreductase [Chitinophaga agrisoli]|uniref:NADP-dependent oxidoreductase n=1 Tax=Chitinophaga agrisoli TaxID=2607653 RepID=A0A5B2VT27_9BACT|nr:NADP-dependent oxidoreductase [Chitinophaga agrisoli]KAA2242953.1 NADP-dependent oxidoreductase [Chitinophaga agrisoli]